MIKRSGFLCKFFALLLALTFLLGQPVSAVAGSSAPAQSTEKNEQLLSYLTGLYGEEEAEPCCKICGTWACWTRTGPPHL